jgi:O-antigen ligase
VQFNTRNFFAGGRRDAHSTYLLTMAETGYIGFLFFTGIILSTLIYVRRVRRRARYRMPKSALQLYYLQNAMIAFLIAGMFGSFSYLHLLYIYLAVCWAWAKMVSTKLAAAGAVESAARSVTPVQPALSASPGYG